MIKVIIPDDNDNINEYFNVNEAMDDLTKLNYKLLNDVLIKSFGSIPNDYEIEFIDRSNGQYLVFETDIEKKWVSFSADYTRRKGDTGSTNAYFVESIPMALADYYLDNTTKNKKIELYLMGINHNRAKTPAQQIYYRLAKTVGISILNEDLFGIEIRRNITFPFEDINEWKLARLNMRNSNSSNKPSYIIENDDAYTFYGKTFGANGRESIFILYVLAHLAKKENKPIYLYEVTDNGSFSFESPRNNEEYTKFKSMLVDLGIIYFVDSIEYVDNEEYEKLDDKNKSSRYQAEFMRNLLIKYNSKRDSAGNIVCDSHGRPIILDDIKRCYLCDCDIQQLIIASHIHRVSDIDKMDLPFSEKRKLAVDADNGLWLCANHDKLFEYGLIYFENNKLKVSKELNDNQMKYVKYLTFDIKSKINRLNSLTEFMVAEEDATYGQNGYSIGENTFIIKDCYYNDNMHNYLKIHRERTQE